MAEALPIMPTGGGMNIAQLIQQLLPIFGGTGQTTTGSTGTTSSTTGGTQTQTGGMAIDPAINQLLTNLFGQVQAGNTGYTKEAAIADSAGVIQELVRSTIESQMPSVLSGGRAAGIYNDSTRTMLNNDLQARMAGQAATAVNDLITRYATITQGNNQTAAQIGGALAQGNRTQTQETTNNQTQTQQQQQQQQQQTAPLVGRGAGSNALIGAGLTAGIPLLKQLPWDKLFGGGSSGGLDLGGVFNGIGEVINPGNVLNAGYGMMSGFDTGSLSDFGSALSGVTANAGYDFANIIPDAAEHVTNFSGLGSDLTGVFAGGGSDLATGIGSALDDGGGLLSGIGGALSGGWDWLSDAFGGFGDWLGGLFMANGGQVPMRNQIMNFANGGRVPQKTDFANGGQNKRGRPGRAAYDENAMAGRVYDISRALWEEMVKNGQVPPGAGPTSGVGGIEAPMVGEGGGGSPAPNYVAAGDPRLRAVIDRIRGQIQGSMAAAQPTDAQQATQLAGRARSVTNIADKFESAFGAATPAASLAGAQLGGASSALAGSPIQIATQLAESGAAAGGIGAGSSGGIAAGGGADAAVSAGLGAGAGAGAGALAGSLGTVDVLGSMLGTGAFLPSYGAAAGAAGTSAAAGGAGMFGGAAAGGSTGAGIGGSAGGAAGGLTALPVAAVAAVVFDGIMKAFASKDDDLRTAWMKAAIDPKVTFADQGTLGFGMGAMPVPTFFRKYYKDVDWGNQDSINQAYQAASEAIMGDALIQPYVDPQQQGFSGGTSAWNDTSPENLQQAQAFASYLNDYLVDNPEQAQTAFQSPIVMPDAPTDANPMPTQNTSTGTPQDPSWQFVRNPETGAFVGGDLAQLEYDRANGIGGRFLANGGMPARGGELPDQKNDPQGKADNIQINVSGGEYVMPKDVVDILGPEFFDNLVMKFHTPFPDRPPTK